MTIIAKSDVNKFFDLLAFSDNRIRFYIGFGDFVASNTVMQKGRWYHIAATFKANVEMRMYVNGVLENTQPISGGRTANNSPLTIGTSAFDRTRNFGGVQRGGAPRFLPHLYSLTHQWPVRIRYSTRSL